MLAARFLEGSKGPIFVTVRGSFSDARCVLIVPPFAEEMNKTRPMLAQVAMSLAKRGVVTVLPDFYGTGDSGGEFVEADLDVWLDDLQRVSAWCASEGARVNALLAVRLGAALAAASELSVERTALWQPLFDGGRALTQFLRLRLAATMMGAKPETSAELRRILASEGQLEVAGYALSKKMATDIEALVPPASLPSRLGQVRWMELAHSADVSIAPPTEALLAKSRANGVAVEYSQWVGEPFWSATEIVRHRELVDTTVTFLAGRAA